MNKERDTTKRADTIFSYQIFNISCSVITVLPDWVETTYPTELNINSNKILNFKELQEEVINELLKTVRVDWNDDPGEIEIEDLDFEYKFF